MQEKDVEAMAVQRDAMDLHVARIDPRRGELCPADSV